MVLSYNWKTVLSFQVWNKQSQKQPPEVFCVKRRPATLKRETLAQKFSLNFMKFLRTPLADCFYKVYYNFVFRILFYIKLFWLVFFIFRLTFFRKFYIVEFKWCFYSKHYVERTPTKQSSEAATGGVLWKKLFLKISQNSQENTCTWGSFLIKLLTLVKKRLWHRCFPVNLAKFSRTPFL